MDSVPPVRDHPLYVAGTGASTPGNSTANETVKVADDAATPRDGYVNPQVQVDPQQGMVILQYRDAAGKLVRQVPSEYELRTYQLTQKAGKADSD
jgi:hypothetical protein